MATRGATALTSAPTAALCLIGNELLAGKIRDRNGPYLIDALRSRGVRLAEIRVLADDIDTIAGAVSALSRQHDWVFTTGGVGPTHDDVTIAAVAQAVGREVVQDETLVKAITAYYGDAMVENHLRMANIPAGARLLTGDQGFVPTIVANNVVVMPGVPSLMQLCFDRVAPELEGVAFVDAVLYLNVHESAVAEVLADIENGFPGVSVGSYPNFEANATYRVKVTLEGHDAAEVDRALASLRDAVPAGAVVESP